MPRQPQIFAHRGARRAAPENTLPAFSVALDMEVDGIELDVHLSRDGQLVVIHDFTLDKTTNGSGLVSDYSAADLAALDAGSHFSPDYADVGVPTLAQVLDLVGGDCRINVEIKSMDPEGGPAVEPLAEMIRARGLYDQVIVSSFNPISLVKMRWVDPLVRLGLLYEVRLPPHLHYAWFTSIMDPEAIHPQSPLVNESEMQWAKARGLEVNAWTVNVIEEARRLVALGVDALITDIPDILIGALADESPRYLDTEMMVQREWL
jgi:glycerophosphoryl diester phosphodiesterase